MNKNWKCERTLTQLHEIKIEMITEKFKYF